MSPHTPSLLAAMAAVTLVTACAPEDISDLEDALQDATTPAAGDADLVEQINVLEVAPEEHEGSYDRDVFGEYDRDAVLSRGQDEWPDCDGHYSLYDDTCHSSVDDVDIDEVVARAEAWRSGAHGWDSSTLDEFGGDPVNLVVMTSEVNQHEKSDNDPADWTPAANECAFVEQWIEVKTSYGLTADQDEVDALHTLVSDC